MNKYRAKKTQYNGRLYDSKGEAQLAQNIDLLVRVGEVKQVTPQAVFKLRGQNGSIVCKHIVDFLLEMADGTIEAWEYKGMETATWKLKRKLFVDNYPHIKYVTLKNSDL